MMPGLLEGQEKMSKSDPNSAIFMEDSEAEVRGAGAAGRAAAHPSTRHTAADTCPPARPSA
jgi:tryptophanyl-tRNA synthetase